MKLRLSTGPQFVYIENCNYAISSATFAKCLTGVTHRDREYGKNNSELELPVWCVWIGTGNNVYMSQEMSRRTVSIRLDANCEQPALRKGFKHALPDWAYENRTQLVAACLTLIRAWVAAGMPQIQPPEPMGSYGRWAETMNGILTTVGIDGFLSNWPNVTTEVNTTEAEWEEMVINWMAHFGSEWVTAQELYNELIYDMSTYNPRLLSSIFNHKGSPVVQLGHALSRQKDVIVAGYKIEHQDARRSHDRKGRWRVMPVSVSDDVEAAVQDLIDAEAALRKMGAEVSEPMDFTERPGPTKPNMNGEGI